MKERLYSNPRLLDKSRAALSADREVGSGLCRRCFPAAGKVEVKDAVRVILPTAAGIAIVVAVPVGGWRFELSTYDGFAVAQPAAATADGDGRSSQVRHRRVARPVCRPRAPLRLRSRLHRIKDFERAGLAP